MINKLEVKAMKVGGKTKRLLSEIQNILSEDYLIDDKEEPEYDDNEGEEGMDDGTDIDFTKADIEMDDNKIINKIRELALNGIQKYAEDIMNPLYEFYKKIWSECDKLIIDSNKQNSQQ